MLVLDKNDLDWFVKKEKIYRCLWDVFLMLWTLLSLGRDNDGLKNSIQLKLFFGKQSYYMKCINRVLTRYDMIFLQKLINLNKNAMTTMLSRQIKNKAHRKKLPISIRNQQEQIWTCILDSSLGHLISKTYLYKVSNTTLQV